MADSKLYSLYIFCIFISTVLFSSTSLAKSSPLASSSSSSSTDVGLLLLKIKPLLQGHLEEAEQLILNMPIEPDDVIWKALLSACKLHGNIQMGERTAGILMDLFPYDSGSYVALSNIFASRENWDGVAEVSLKMKEMDIRKDPGCSWIELEGVIHEFLVEDDIHPRAKEIHSMLNEISNRLRSAGYRPNITQVMLNMDKDDKESAFHYHSKSIAIASGLISTSPQTPLRIVKNLRVCEDCHSSIKLISELY